MRSLALAFRLALLATAVFAAQLLIFFPFHHWLAAHDASRLVSLPLFPLAAATALAVAKFRGAAFRECGFVVMVVAVGFTIFAACLGVFVLGVLSAAIALSVSEYAVVGNNAAMVVLMAIASVGFVVACSVLIGKLRRDYPASFAAPRPPV
ncbi:MAG: hypothetical protein AB2L09_12795 [Coriobacteriia bacterium]